MKGIYCLLLELKKNFSVKIGKLGLIDFEKGNYVYVGSAQNGIEKRIKRHLERRKKLFWYIDYLTANFYVKIKKVLVKEAGKEEECLTSKKIVGKAILNFGCSDCKCKSHLFKIDKGLQISDFQEL